MNPKEQELYYLFESSYRIYLEESKTKINYKKLNSNLEQMLKSFKQFFGLKRNIYKLLKLEENWWLYRMVEARNLLMKKTIPVDECLVLLARKNIGYSNVQWSITGTTGTSSRCIEKLCRLIYGKGSTLKESERDTYIDLFNYILISLLFLDGKLK